MVIFHRNLFAIGCSGRLCDSARDASRERERLKGYGYLGREVVAVSCNLGARAVVVDWVPATMPKATSTWVLRVMERQLQRILARRFDRG